MTSSAPNFKDSVRAFRASLLTEFAELQRERQAAKVAHYRLDASEEARLRSLSDARAAVAARLVLFDDILDQVLARTAKATA